MKRMAIVFCWMWLLSGSFSTMTAVADEKLTNASVIEMHKLGLGDSVVIEKIKVSACDFDVSLGALKQLKEAGISDPVMQAMIAVGSPIRPTVTVVGAATGDVNDPRAAHETGIWLCEEQDGKNKMTMLVPNTFDQASTGSGFGVAWGGTAKMRSELQGIHAELQIPNSKPVFYFYFDEAGSSLSSASKVATAPNDFALVQMEIRKQRRRVETGKVSLGGAKQGLGVKAIRPFRSEKVAEGIYKVIPQDDLPDGEYAFVYKVSAYGGKVFDFGIRTGINPPKK